jgi:hypothetical protein
MDNSQYGGPEARTDDPRSETMAGVRECVASFDQEAGFSRVFPMGRGFRQFDSEKLRLLLDALGDPDPEITVYAYSQQGWQLSDLASAEKAECRDYQAAPRRVDDQAAAA